MNAVPAAEPVRRTAEIEDPSNLFLIHPVSTALTHLFARLGVRPNMVSLAGMACGILAGVAYYHHERVGAVLAGFALMLAWHVMDGADGQLARLTNAQSEIGKVLDGICDYTTFVAVYLALALSSSAQYGATVWLVVIASGCCHAVQSAAYEAQRHEYEFWVLGKKPAAPVQPARRPAAGLWHDVSHRLDGLYARVQSLAAGSTPAFHQRLAAVARARPELAPRIRSLYRTMFAGPVRRWSLMSANYRTLGIFVFTLAKLPLYYFLAEIVLWSAVHLVLTSRQRVLQDTLLQRLAATA